MQLDAVLSSLQNHCLDIDRHDVVVNYTYDDNRYKHQYEKLISQYNHIKFVTRTELACDIRSVLTQTEYILFCSDDVIFMKDFTLSDAVISLSRSQTAIGFLLRIGLNIKMNLAEDYNYFLVHPPQEFRQVCHGIIEYDWGITNTNHLATDSIPSGDLHWIADIVCGLYKSDTIYDSLFKGIINIPHDIEFRIWDGIANGQIKKPTVLCFNQSVVAQIGINRTDRVPIGPYTIDYLADLFDNGYRILTPVFSGCVPCATYLKHTLPFYKCDEMNINNYISSWKVSPCNDL